MKSQPNKNISQSFKSIINNQFTSTLQFHRRPSKPITSFRQQHQHDNEVKAKLILSYEELKQTIQKHINCFRNVARTLHNINDSYFLMISKIVEEERKKMNTQLKEQISIYEHKLHHHQVQVKQKLQQIKKQSYFSFEDQKVFEDLAKIQKPTFHLEKSRIENIFPFLQTIKPQYGLLQKENKKPQKYEIQTQQTDGSQNPMTVKKEKKHNQEVFDFSCDEELNWEEPNKQTKRHEIVSEIIFEEPSSCQDSLLSNQFS